MVSSIICRSKKLQLCKNPFHSLCFYIKKKKKRKSSNKIKDNHPSFLFIFFKFLCWPYFQSFSVAMTYRERNSKKEQAEHRTVTIRQIWIASNGMSHGAYLARFRNKQTNTNRTRSTDRFIVRLRGLNRAVEHQKYELRNDTVSKAVIRPRSNVETINPIPVKRINDVFSSFQQRQRKRVRFEFLSSWISRISVLPDCRWNLKTNSRTREWFENFTACQKCFISIKLFQNTKGSSRIFLSLFIPIQSFSNWFMIELYIRSNYILNFYNQPVNRVDFTHWRKKLEIFSR